MRVVSCRSFIQVVCQYCFVHSMLVASIAPSEGYGHYSCNDLVNLPKLDGCTIDQDELPILSISVNCTSGLVVVNRTDFTHEALDGKAIVDVILEYNATNITTGESEIIRVHRNSLELFGTPNVVFEDGFSQYEFKACVAFQQYPCWIFNEQKLSCTFDLSSQSSLSSFLSTTSTSGTVHIPTTSRSSSLNSPTLSSPITFAPSSSSSSFLGTYLYDPSPSSPSSFSPSSSPSSDSAVSPNNLPTIIIAVILTIVGVVISLILALFAQVLCYFKLRSRIESKVVKQSNEIYLKPSK